MKKIMVVDDDKEFLDEITEVLKNSGYDTVALSHGGEVFERACLDKPDVILMDLQMEGEGGLGIADKLSHSPETEHIPLIAITGVYVKERLRLIIKLCGFKKRLIKPVNPLDVIAAIEEVAGK